MMSAGKREIEIPLLEEIKKTGGAARAAVVGRKMNTNGWSFRQYRAESGTIRTVADARRDFLAKGR